MATVFQILSVISLALLGLYCVLILIGGWYMHYSLKGVATRPPKSEIISMYDFEDVELEGANRNILKAWFIKGQNIANDQTIILVHGWGHTRATMIEHIHLFVQNGFNVFMYDQRSHGASDVARLSFGPTEGQDFRRALDYVCSRQDINTEKIATLGISLGGAAIVCGAPYEGKLKAIVWEGAWAFDECMTGYMAENRFGFVPGVIIKSALALGAALWGDGRPNHGYPVQYIGNIHPTPILFIRGCDDRTVPEPCAAAVINAAQEPKEIWYHKNGGHRRAIEHYPDEYKSRVITFLSKHL